MRRLLLVVWVCVAIAGWSPAAAAKDLIITNQVESSLDKRFEYPHRLLRRALEVTQEEYGLFELQRHALSMSRKRALKELVEGNLTVFEAPTQQSWEEQAIPVRIPLRKGLLGYRLFLIREKDQETFRRISSLDALKKLHMGLKQQWTITAKMQDLGFTIFFGKSYEKLFEMLSYGRFDYFPRALNEVFSEYETRKKLYPNLRIEQNLALFLPLPSYFFVTPTRPDLAERVATGLQQMMADGEFEKMFLEEHKDYLQAANLKQRRIFRLEDASLPPLTPLDDARLWHEP